MTSAARHPGPAAEPRPELDELRDSLSQMFGAERRLRGREHNRPGELTHAQLRSITALGREREMTAGQLAKSADLKPATVTEMLDHLEAANIVQRHRSTEDRRVCLVSLTDEGWQLLERKLASWQALWESRLSQFTDTEIHAAARIMREITDMLDSLAAASPGEPEQKP